MDRLLALAAAALVAGCSPSGPTRFVAGSAVLTAVSSDQKSVAILANAQRLPTGAHIGQLEVVPTNGQLPTMLDPSSSGGVFNRGNTLWYLGGATVVDEGTPAVAHVYGALYVWTPDLGEPIKIGDHVREFTVSQNGATCVFMDWTDKSNAPTNTGSLIVVTVASCGMGQCEKFALGSSLTAAQASWRVSNDGKYVLGIVRGAASTDPGRVVLLEPGTGGMHVLSTGVDPRAPMLQATGETAAWVEGANEVHVVATALTAPPTVLTPTSPIVDTAAMIDGGSYVLKTRENATGPASAQKLTAAGTTMLTLNAHPLDLYISQYVPGKTDRYLLFSTTTSTTTGEHDLWLLDLGTPDAQPVMLAQMIDDPIGAAVGYSDDGSTIQYFDNFDPVTRRGDDYVVPLATPTRSLVALGVHNAGFIPGTTELLYVAAPDPSTGAGVLTLLPSPSAATLVQTVAAVNFIDTRQPPARTWYTVASAGHDGDGVWYMAQP